MERLTKYLASGAADYNYPAGCYSGNDCNDRVAKSAYRQTCVERLAAYEETGLTPEESKRMSNILMDVGIDYNCSMNGEAINKANEIANLKADADVLRNKLADTEAALGRANACIATMKVERDQQTKDCFEWQRSAQNLHDDLLNARERANYAEAHPWRNLWAWLKRKLKMA